MKSATIGILLMAALTLALLFIAKLVSARRLKDMQKSTPFECGFDPYGSGRFPFSLHFFLMAILFLLFDLEIALLYPLATLELGHISASSAITAFLFLGIVLVGLIHEWNEGSLQWKM
uniref:NADH dehydrogenase subunit 3 n=1 Tax=Scurria scurra TaxID=351200 RepID=UPI001EDCF9A4|nr:NADH dehydrogenase subunit 3 [Scurria scurra]UHY95072.1 NADH dehydrogenase subunit 3 [Scurria scurra]